jgi:hypothetical protein
MKVVITIEVKDQEQARLIAKALQDETVRAVVTIMGKLHELDVDPRDHRRVIDMAFEMKFGKGRH